MILLPCDVGGGESDITRSVNSWQDLRQHHDETSYSRKESKKNHHFILATVVPTTGFEKLLKTLYLSLIVLMLSSELDQRWSSHQRHSYVSARLYAQQQQHNHHLQQHQQHQSKPALIDDLIESRLETSQLCGTRYPLTGQFFKATEMDRGYKGIGDDGGGGDDFELSDDGNKNGDAGGSNLLYIVGGDEVEDDQFWPWSVAIYELDPLNGQKAFICSGSLISEKFILTAAHCIQQSRFDILTPDEVFLKIASVRLDDFRAGFYQVEKIFLHPEYTVDRKTNDIALLKLKYGQRLPARARPICLPSHVANRIDFTDQQVTIIGWGKTSAMHGYEPTRLIDIVHNETRHTGGMEYVSDVDRSEMLAKKGIPYTANESATREDSSTSSSNSQTNDTLLQAEVRVTNTEQCNKNYSRLEIDWLTIDEHFLCASDPQGKRDACQGDSGGPLMWNNQHAAMMGQQQFYQSSPEKWYQLGLVSFGYGCANKQYPGVYTRISYYMPWILRTVNERRAPINGNHFQQNANSNHQANYYL